MNNYILKNIKNEQNILIYQEKANYKFSPKKDYKGKIEVTVLDKDMLNTLWNNKLAKYYDKALKLIYILIQNDDTTSSDVLEAYTEINRIKEYLLSLQDKGLKKEILDKYLKKLYVLELELKKVHVIELKEEIGKGR